MASSHTTTPSPRSRFPEASTVLANGTATPPGDEAIWKRLWDAGFDEETVKRRDKAALIAYITKLETEVYSYQHHMGHLLMDRKDWELKYEQLKASSESVEIAYKREQAKQFSALAEARLREQNLKKSLAIEKECVKNIEKALHDTRAESAERKLTSESKIAEARKMMEAAQEKSDEADKKLLAAESLHAEANRIRSTTIRTLEDIEAREDDLRRRLLSSKSEIDAKENEIRIQRQALNDRQKILNQEQQSLQECQTLLNQRDEFITERTMDLSRLEKEVNDAKANLEENLTRLRENRSNLDLEKAVIESKEEAILKREALLEKRERELLILQEKIACKENDEIQRIVSEHESFLEKKKNEFEIEIEQRRKLFEDDLVARRVACEAREADLSDREHSILERDCSLQLQSSLLVEKQEDLAKKLCLLEEREKNLEFTQQVEFQNMQKEKEDILKMKQDLERTIASLEDEKREILHAEEKLQLTMCERNELFVLETKLKEEIDSFRLQKMELEAEIDKLRTEKEKFEFQWELIDKEREELNKLSEQIKLERETVSQFLKDERNSIKLDKENLDGHFKRDLESLSREKQEFICEMDRQRADWFRKIEQERASFARDINIQRNELENGINKKREEVETHLREMEAAFEREKAKELEDISYQKEMVKKDLEHVAAEMQKLNDERMEIARDCEQREKEWNEIKSSIVKLNSQREKLQKQRDLLRADREEIYEKICHLKELEDLKIEFESKPLSDIQPDKRSIPEIRILNRSVLHHIDDLDGELPYANGGSALELLPQKASDVSPPTSIAKYWVRKCTEIFWRSPEKKTDNKNKKNDFTEPKSLNFGSKVHNIHGDDNNDNPYIKDGFCERVFAGAGQTEIEPVSPLVDKVRTKVIAKGWSRRNARQLSEGAEQKSATLVHSVNSWILGRKRCSNMLVQDTDDTQLEPSQKQQKRQKQDESAGSVLDSCYSMLETQTQNLGDGSEPEEHEGLCVSLKDQDNANAKACNEGAADVQESTSGVSHNDLDNEDGASVGDESDDDKYEDEDGGSVKKLWRFLIT